MQQAEPLLIGRRSLILGAAAALITAPAIVRAASIMLVRSLRLPLTIAYGVRGPVLYLKASNGEMVEVAYVGFDDPWPVGWRGCGVMIQEMRLVTTGEEDGHGRSGRRGGGVRGVPDGDASEAAAGGADPPGAGGEEDGA